MTDDRYTLLFTEAVRQLDAQGRDLDQLRSRASWLISATAVSTSFLGGGLVRLQAIGTAGWVAIIFFAATFGLALWAMIGPVAHAPAGFSPAVVEQEWIQGRGLDADQIRLNLALQITTAVDHKVDSRGRRNTSRVRS